MRVKTLYLAIIISLVFIVGISATSAMNLWKTESEKIPVKFSTGSYSGEYNPSDIRGSYSFNDVSSLFEIPLEDLATAFGVSHLPDPGTFKNKDLESMYTDLKEEGYEIGNNSVKLFVALYTGLPYDLTVEDSYLLEEATEILKIHSNLTQEQLTYLDTHTIVIKENTPTTAEESLEEEHIPNPQSVSGTEGSDYDISERLVKGKTTFQEVLDWGVNQEAIEEVIGGKMPHPLTKTRDYCLEQELEFSAIKEALQEKVDKN